MSCLECLCCVDCVEGPDVLVVVEGGDDGDDVRLYQVLGHQAHHRVAGVSPLCDVRPCVAGHQVPGPGLRAPYGQRLLSARHEGEGGLLLQQGKHLGRKSALVQHYDGQSTMFQPAANIIKSFVERKGEKIISFPSFDFPFNNEWLMIEWKVCHANDVS